MSHAVQAGSMAQMGHAPGRFPTGSGRHGVGNGRIAFLAVTTGPSATVEVLSRTLLLEYSVFLGREG